MGDNLYADPAAHPSYTLRLEPLTMLAAIADVDQPCRARRHRLDHLQRSVHGRARVRVARSHQRRPRRLECGDHGKSGDAPPISARSHPDHARRYEMASEFIDVVKGLWDCWADDAIVADRVSGLYIDPAKVRALDHEGAFFKVKGPLNIGRAPQGQPVVLQAGGSEPGQSLAARTADVVFSVVQDIDEAKAGYASLKKRLPAFGRKPDDVTVLPGVMPIVGRTDKEACEKLSMLQGFVSGSNALPLLSDRFGQDMTAYELDGPIPDIPHARQLSQLRPRHAGQGAAREHDAARPL